MGVSPKMPFRFTQLRRLPSINSLFLEHWQAHSTTPNDQTRYCVHIRVNLGEGRDNQPSSSHVWSGLLINDILQEACPGDWITEAVVLVLGETILFFGRCLHKEGLLYRNTKDVELGLSGPVSWAERIAQVEVAERTAQVEVTVNTMQEGHWAIVDVIMEKKIKARGPRNPQGLRRPNQSSAASCNVND